MLRTSGSSLPAGQQTPGSKPEKPLRSLVDETLAVLQSIDNNLDPRLKQTLCVSSWTAIPADRGNGGGSCSTSSALVDWTSLPEAVDPSSMAMGLSTAKSTKKRAKKLQKFNADKVADRASRKRCQVESFYIVLQWLLGSAGSRQFACSTEAQQHMQCAQQDGNFQQQQQQQAHASHQPQQQFMVQQQRQQPQRLKPGQQLLQQDHCASQQQVQQCCQPLHVVDFGCGSGNLLLPLAALFPACTCTAVDMKPAALQLLQQRALEAGLSNVRIFQGMIEQFNQPFDVALALHACGNATDHVLQMAVAQGAAFIVSPCCVGKLKLSMAGGSSFHGDSIVSWTPTLPGDKPVSAATASLQQQQSQQLGQMSQDRQRLPLQQQHQEEQTQEQQHGAVQQQVLLAGQLRHPRSNWLRSQLPDPERHFRTMARVADIAHAPKDQAQLRDALAERALVADICNRFVELDRCAAAAEAGYAVGLFKVLEADSMAKNDLLLGLPLRTTAGRTTNCSLMSTCCMDMGLLVGAEAFVIS